VALTPALPGTETAPPEPLPAASAPAEQGTAAASPANPESDDPEKNARALAERSRVEAQNELKKLKDEAERLRARLGKVEAGIRRWEALLAAIEGSETPATQLDPVPRATQSSEARDSTPTAPRVEEKSPAATDPRPSAGDASPKPLDLPSPRTGSAPR
jgi:hypothetical protein